MVSFKSFCVFWLVCFTISLLGVIFENKLIALEKKYKLERKVKKEAKVCNSKAKKH